MDLVLAALLHRADGTGAAIDALIDAWVAGLLIEGQEGVGAQVTSLRPIS